MRRSCLSFAGLLIGCSTQLEPRAAPSGPPASEWEDLRTVEQTPVATNDVPPPRPRISHTIVLGAGEAAVYPTAEELAAGRQTASGPQTLVVQQTINNHYGAYGYGTYSTSAYPYGTYYPGARYETGMARPSATPSPARVVPGSDWARPTDYGPRMVGDRSR